jgi:ribosome-associated toxin RatA of RatAB toxin-antitoxin module
MRRTVEAAARLQGTRESLFAVLGDYGLYQAWVPGVEHSRLLAREGDVAVAELRCPLYSARSFTFELVRSPPSAIDFHHIGHLGRPQVSGRWELGEETAKGVAVRARLAVETPLLKLGSREVMRSVLAATLRRLEERCRRLAAWSGGLAGKSKRKILEVVRRPDGLEISYLGETYRLPQAGGRGG